MPAHIAIQFRADDELVLAGHRIVKRIELIGRFDHTARCRSGPAKDGWMKMLGFLDRHLRGGAAR